MGFSSCFSKAYSIKAVVNNYVANILGSDAHYFTKCSARFIMLEIMNSIPMAITINPIIRDNEFIPEAPNTLDIFLETLRITKIIAEIATIDPTIISLSAKSE